MSPQGLCRMLSPGTQGVWANECISYEKNKTKKLFASNILSGAYFVPGIVTRASKKKKLEKVSILSLQLISLLCLITWALFEVVMVLTGHVLGLGWHHLAEAFPGRICPVLINGSVNSHACISCGCYTLG